MQRPHKIKKKENKIENMKLNTKTPPDVEDLYNLSPPPPRLTPIESQFLRCGLTNDYL